MKDVDLDAGTIAIQRSLQRQTGLGLQFVELKTRQSRRKITLVSLAAEALRAHRIWQAERRLQAGREWADLDLVFTSDIGTPLDPMNAYHRFQIALKRAGLPPMRLHDLRHTAATLMAAAGLDPSLSSGPSVMRA